MHTTIATNILDQVRSKLIHFGINFFSVTSKPLRFICCHSRKTNLLKKILTFRLWIFFQPWSCIYKIWMPTQDFVFWFNQCWFKCYKSFVKCVLLPLQKTALYLNRPSFLTFLTFILLRFRSRWESWTSSSRWRRRSCREPPSTGLSCRWLITFYIIELANLKITKKRRFEL